MLKTLLLLFVLTLPVFAVAQKTMSSTSAQERMLKRPPLSPQKFVVDTIGPAILADTCARSAFPYQTSEGGYIFGSNGYGDVVKLQRLVYPAAAAPFAVTEVSVAFSAADAAVADRFVAVEIYAELNPDSTLGAFLGVSDSIRVGDLLVSETSVPFTSFTFPEPVQVDNDSFFVAIDFSDTYGTTQEGFVGVFSTRDGCGNGRNVLEIFPVDGGFGYGSVFDNWSGLQAEMFILAVVDTDINTSTRSAPADYGALIAPNPTRGLLTLSFRAATSGDYRTTLTDLNGRAVRHQSARSVSGTVRTEWDLRGLPAGLYLYHIDGPNGRQSGKVIKR